jgi:hypothetical protein
LSNATHEHFYTNDFTAALADSGRVAHPFALFLLTNARGWMIPLQYVNAE